MKTNLAQEKPLHVRLEFAVSLIMESKKKIRKLGNVDPELLLQMHHDLEHAKFILLGQANRLRRELSLPVISVSQLKHQWLNRALEYPSPSEALPQQNLRKECGV